MEVFKLGGVTWLAVKFRGVFDSSVQCGREHKWSQEKQQGGVPLMGWYKAVTVRKDRRGWIQEMLRK